MATIFVDDTEITQDMSHNSIYTALKKVSRVILNKIRDNVPLGDAEISMVHIVDVKLAAGEDCFSDYSITIALSSLDNPIPYMTINFMVEGFWDKDYSKIHNWTPAYNMTWNGEYTISTWQKHEKECIDNYGLSKPNPDRFKDKSESKMDEEKKLNKLVDSFNHLISALNNFKDEFTSTVLKDSTKNN